MDVDPDVWDENFNPCPSRLRVREETSKRLQEMLKEASSDSSERINAPTERRRKRKREEASSSQDTSSTPTKADSRFAVIPETPEDKLIANQEHYNEVVPQTPMAKLFQANRRPSQKLHKLLILSEERIRTSCAAAAASEKEKKMKLRRIIAPNVSKESLLALYSPSTKRARRCNLFPSQLLTQIRRSSSLQFPVIVSASEDGSRLSSLGSPSSTSINMNMSGPSVNNSMSQTSFYGSMSSYRCCCGLIRLRVGACLIGVASIGISIFTMCLLLSLSGAFSREMQASLTLPLSALVLYQTASAMLLIIGVLIDTYPLLLPFLINCVLHGLLAVSGVALLLLLSKDFRRHCPVVVIGGATILLIYVWFGSVIGLTFVLIRDKKSRGLYMEAPTDVRVGLDRAESSFL